MRVRIDASLKVNAEPFDASGVGAFNEAQAFARHWLSFECRMDGSEQRWNLIRGDGPRKQVALEEVAMQFAQTGHLVFGFDSLSHHLVAQCVRHRDDGLHDCVRILGAAWGHERLVDLQDRSAQVPQPRKR